MMISIILLLWFCSAAYALSQAGVWKSRVELFRGCLRRHSGRSFDRLLQHCAHIDAISKGVHSGDVWDELLVLGDRLAGGSRSNTKT